MAKKNESSPIANSPLTDEVPDTRAPEYTLTVLEKILSELQRISSILEQGNRNTRLKRPGAVRYR